MMKKWIILLSALIVIATSVVSYGVYHLMPERNRVQFNPFIHEQYSYVQINNAGIKDAASGTVEYTLPAWREDGTMQQTTFTGMKKLRSGAYIRLVSKDGYILSYNEVQPNELPATVSAKIAEDPKQ
ncbi:YxeA family protein [Paenibacillus hunanensis]|uniref:YxeA family protein n=1 Tax=Paenibacillus hunanensis TaxID=539262 RepID=UPI002026A72A|nr:YxeA family protein [Paenibacillus hunanensis]MCL9660983.1 YxeA family protein [Paenibacillus hunanensis]